MELLIHFYFVFLNSIIKIIIYYTFLETAYDLKMHITSQNLKK